MSSYELYRPLRNHLRQVDIRESLLAVRAYSDWALRRKALPPDFQIPHHFRLGNPVALGVHPFQLETFCKEVVINGQITDRPRESLKNWNYFSRGMNKLKQLEESLYVTQVGAEQIWTDLVRGAHRQFPWQSRRPSTNLITRYYKLYSSRHIRDAFEDAFSCSPSLFYLLMTQIFGRFSQQFSVDYPVTVNIESISTEQLNAILNWLSLDIRDLQSELREQNVIDEKYAYRFNVLRKYPLIRFDQYGRNEIISPIPVFILWRATDGVYYDLCGTGDFGDRFGHAFQDYVGDVLRRALEDSNVTIIPERSYQDGRSRKDTVDWIVHDKAALFIEAKTKRMAQSAKEEIESDDALNAQLSFQSGHVVQVYKSICDYEKGLYPGFPFDPNREIYPVILTLEDWHLFGDRQLDYIDRQVKLELQAQHIDPSICIRYPYTFCSVGDFESCAQIVAKLGVANALGGKAKDEKYANWELHAYLA